MKVTKCDLCGQTVTSNLYNSNNYRIIVQRKRWCGFTSTYDDIDICNDCLKVLREKTTKKENKNEENT